MYYSALMDALYCGKQRDHFDWGGRFTGLYGTVTSTRSATASSAISN
jgi:hypothetical protein